MGNKKAKPAKILLDVPVDDGVLGFDNYRDALINIIKSSDPRFTIGIFGGWGTGKTTLMRMMKKKLDDEGEVTVWFNPWEYEKEEHLIIPLLQTINFELKDKKLLNPQTLKKFGKAILALTSGFTAKIPVIGVELSPKDAIESYQKLFESKNLSSLYFDLKQQLKDIIKELKEKEKSRMIIFIDDLDRCLPSNALQILESVKLFLDAEGYVFVLGLDRNIIEKCVNRKYGEESGISGTDYIKKMIQVPFNLPRLREQEVKAYVERLRDELKGTDVEEYVEKYIDIISKGMEANPREIKRFINNFILVNQISAGEIEPDKLLVLLIIYFRWDELYEKIVSLKKDFLDKLKYYMDIKPGVTDEKGIEVLKKHCGIHYDFFTKMEAHPLYSFLKGKEGKTLFEIDDLDPYIHFSRAATIPEPEKPKILKKEELISLLKSGRIEEFNKIRPRPFVNLSGADLSSAYLRGAYLSEADLSEANLSGADLSEANLRGTDLNKADLRGAHLIEADLRGARLIEADLSGAYLRGAYLRGADLRGADLSEADLSAANLNEAILVRAKLFGVNLSVANLSGADMMEADLSEVIIDDYTIFNKTIIQYVKNLSRTIRDTLDIEIEDGVEKATSKWVLEEKAKMHRRV